MRIPEYKILSLDGGGIRGIIPCAILKFIEDNTGYPIARLFNLIAGTSTGGIISLGLTMQGQVRRNAFSAADMLDLYLKNGSVIFEKRPKDILSWLHSELFDKPYDDNGIETILQQYFGESRLKDALTDVLVTTYEIESGRPFYFSSRLAKKNAKEDFLIKEIARSTSAAPTYFQPSIVQYNEAEDLAFVDGGVFANNPSILAYSEAKELWKERVRAEIAPGNMVKNFEPVVAPDDWDLPFYMLSIGTGYTKQSIKGLKANDFRNKDWIKPLLKNVFMRSMAASTHYTMQHLLPPYNDNWKRYDRIDFEIPEAISEMDDASKENIERLLEETERYIKVNKRYLEEVCNIIS
jgi:predicted acylesterase/phospholipase RssA